MKTKEYLLNNWDKFETCIPYYNPTTLIEEGNHLYIKYIPDCFDCENTNCEDGEYYDECTSQTPIIINSDGTINFNNYTNIDKENFTKNFSSFMY